MNVENMLKVARAIEAHKAWFTMDTFGNHYSIKLIEQMEEEGDNVCGTAGCIAGFTRNLAQDEIAYNDELKANLCVSYTSTQRFTQGEIIESSSCVAQKYFDITYYEADDLFYGKQTWAKYRDELGITENPYDNLKVITADMAITMLTNLATGEWTFWDKETDEYYDWSNQLEDEDDEEWDEDDDDEDEDDGDYEDDELWDDDDEDDDEDDNDDDEDEPTDKVTDTVIETEEQKD